NFIRVGVEISGCRGIYSSFCLKEMYWYVTFYGFPRLIGYGEVLHTEGGGMASPSAATLSPLRRKDGGGGGTGESRDEAEASLRPLEPESVDIEMPESDRRIGGFRNYVILMLLMVKTICSKKIDVLIVGTSGSRNQLLSGDATGGAYFSHINLIQRNKSKISSLTCFGVDMTPDNFAVAIVYFVQGVLGLARLAVNFYLKDDLHLDPAEVTHLLFYF
ncbi:hypothetical protein BHE74_00035144, partial [Ensete ventricosum]